MQGLGCCDQICTGIGQACLLGPGALVLNVGFIAGSTLQLCLALVLRDHLQRLRSLVKRPKCAPRIDTVMGVQITADLLEALSEYFRGLATTGRNVHSKVVAFQVCKFIYALV